MSFTDDVINAMSTQNQNLQALSGAVSDLYSQKISTFTYQQSLASQGTDRNGDTALTVQTRELAELQAQKNSRKFASAIGSNMDDTSEILSSLGMQLRGKEQEAIAAKAEVTQKASVGLFDNPIEYILNQVTLPSSRAKAQGLEEEASSISTAMQRINSASQDTVRTNNAIAETKTVASIANKVAATKANIDAQALAVKQQSLSFNVEALNAAANISEKQLSNFFQANSQEIAFKQLDIAQESAKNQRELKELEIKKLGLILDDKEENKADQQALVNTINIPIAARGLAPLNIKQIKLLQSTPKGKEQITDLLYSGILSQSVGSSVIAETPGMAAKMMIQGGENLPEIKKPIANILKQEFMSATKAQTYKELQSDGTYKEVRYDATKLPEVISAVNNNLKIKSREWINNIDPKDKTNPYVIPPLASIVTIIPDIVNDEFFKKIISPQMTTAGLSEAEPDKIAGLAKTAIKQGMPMETVLDGLTKLYSAGVLTNNITKGYTSFGLPYQKSGNYINNVTSTNKSFGEFGFISGGKSTSSVNMVDKVSWSKYLSAQLAEDRRSLVTPVSTNINLDSLPYFTRK